MTTDDASTTIMAARPQYTPHPLGDLPVELLYRIARHLSTVEFCAFRLSCRTVEQRLFRAFSHEFFSRKQFMMSGFSLQALIDIARHPNLSGKLEHVTIGLDYLGNFMAQVYSPSADSRLYQEALADQSTLFSSGRAVEMLTEAFSHLPNLKTVSIRDSASRTRFRDFNSGLRHWHSYGYPTFLKTTGFRGSCSSANENTVFVTHVFNAVSTALARSGARPENIELLLCDKKQGVLDTGFWISPSVTEQERHKNLLAGVRKLHLAIVLNRFSDSTNYAIRIPEILRLTLPQMVVDGVQSGINCNQYIAHTAQNLEWLRINFHGDEEKGINTNGSCTADSFVQYFTNPSGSSEDIDDKIVYPKLKRLDLGHARVDGFCVYKMLEGLPTIETLSLYKITLVSEEDRGSGRVLLWKEFLAQMPVVTPNLKRVQISKPLERIRARTYKVVLEREHDNINIQVEEGENLLDKCLEAVEKLEYRHTTPELDIIDDGDDDGDEEGDEDEEHDQGDHEDDEGQEEHEEAEE